LLLFFQEKKLFLSFHQKFFINESSI
jgi:hypothetical protein